MPESKEAPRCPTCGQTLVRLIEIPEGKKRPSCQYFHCEWCGQVQVVESEQKKPS